jgi:anaerobic magnesium-protoporphyrin IX monomethyl ester cyclase
MRTVLTTLHSKFIHASLALPYLAAFCRTDCGEIILREFTVHEPAENVLAALLDEQPDVVAFSVYLWNRRESLELADALAVARPGIRIVLGGPEISYEGAQFFDRYPGVSALVHGEGELPLKGLLAAWAAGDEPSEVPRLSLRSASGIVQGPHAPPLPDLDTIPSPFALGLIDLSRGFVYYETSRGCPYTCAFCMSARDDRVRAFSRERIHSDLRILIDAGVPKIKLVDRTFNYDAARAREIFSFILIHNRKSHFHFEIGAHLLDEATLTLLDEVPPGMFQFEIGVQSTLPATLNAIGRSASLERLENAVRRLRARNNIHLHLDLIAGLPGEGFSDFLQSIDRVAALHPHELQVEAVKLLPGAPLRDRAEELGLRYTPHPPYTILGTPSLSFNELEILRGIARLLDLTWNSGRFGNFLTALARLSGSTSQGISRLETFFRREGLFRQSLSQRSLFEEIWRFVQDEFADGALDDLRESLARDFALCERVVPENAPAFFDTNFEEEERILIRERVRRETSALKGGGVKIQFFAAVFRRLPDAGHRTVVIFIYLIRSGQRMEVREISLG